MASLRTLLRSFSAGEITPELFGRVDLNKRQEGLETCRNFITLPHGPAVNRAGTEFVREVKDSSKIVRLLPFSYNNEQTFVIELGAGYFRFHTQGATLLYANPSSGWSSVTSYVGGEIVSFGGINYYARAPGINKQPNLWPTWWYALPMSPNVYEIPNAYTEAMLPDVRYTQSADVMTLVHPDLSVAELRRYGATDWRLAPPAFGAPANALTGVTASNNGAATTPTLYSYVVTEVRTVGLQESLASFPIATASNDLTVVGRKNTISWTDGTGLNIRYNVYKLSNGLYGYIGQTSATTFDDDNITPDVANVPPINDGVFDLAGVYPQAVGYFQQRRCFAGATSMPQNFWATRSGTESDMSYSIPVQSDDRISVRLAAREASAIRHIVPAAQLLLLTATSEWKCSADGNGGVLTPASISLTPQSYIGANTVTPVVVNNIVLYAASRGGHIRELSYSWQASGYTSGDVSLFAPHLFDYASIKDMGYTRGPVPILWAVSSTGALLGMTYVPEQQVAAWHRHDTGDSDAFEAIAVVTEGNDDVLYTIVRRTIGGTPKRYVERMHTRQYSTISDAYFVDCGATYSGAPVGSVSGMTWLEGRTVSVLADGAVQPQVVVTGGVVSLPAGVTASKITVGLPIAAQLKTLPVAAQTDGGMAQGRQKNINRAWLRVYRSSGIKAGPDFNNLVPYRLRSTELPGSPPALVTDEVEIVLTPSWGASGQVCVAQTDPLPLDIASMTLEVALGA